LRQADDPPQATGMFATISAAIGDAFKIAPAQAGGPRA